MNGSTGDGVGFILLTVCIGYVFLMLIVLTQEYSKTKTKLQNYESALNIYIKCREQSTDKYICLRPKVQHYLVVN
jgi:NADH:ubiquinone oxidoreductase subunit 3 (subunit A)